MPGKTVGIIGGMGPEATVDLMKKIIKNTPAKVDEDHLRILVDNNPYVPSRVKAILGEGESPGPVMAEMAKGLVKWGAEILVIPCNTAHLYVGEVTDAVTVPVVNMIDETVKVLLENNIKEVALLASTAVLKTKLYENELLKAGIDLILPTQLYQDKIMEAIFAVKSGNLGYAKELVNVVIKHISEKGAKTAVMGCTELSIVIEKDDAHNLVFYDPTEILAKAVVKEALS
ncbi:MAG: aspartate racemase [Clostridiales bacterium]|jgi:aspartate racemase|nr:aspartate racemase [Clostridiales bacterium]